MNRCLYTLLGLFTLAQVSTVSAQGLKLQNLSDQDYNKVVDELSASFNHTSVSGASPLGHIFGFEVGLVGGTTQTPNINRLVHQSDPNTNVSSIPMAEILGVLTVPAGITVEAGLVPKVGKEDFHFRSMSLAVKWTATELLDLPFSLAVKGHVTGFNIDSKETISSVPTTYDYKSTIAGLTFLGSKDLGLVEPYAGLALLTGTGKMDVTGSSNFVNGQRSASAKRSTTEFLVGAELKLVFFKLGAEYARLFSTDRLAAKLSFTF